MGKKTLLINTLTTHAFDWSHPFTGPSTGKFAVRDVNRLNGVVIINAKPV